MILSRCVRALPAVVLFVAVAACHDLDPDNTPEELPTCTASAECGVASPPARCTDSFDAHLLATYDRCYEGPSLILSVWTCQDSKLKAIRDTWPYSGTIRYYDETTGAPVGTVTVNGNNKKTACAALVPGFVAPADCVASMANVCNSGLPDAG